MRAACAACGFGACGAHCVIVNPIVSKTADVRHSSRVILKKTILFVASDSRRTLSRAIGSHVTVENESLMALNFGY